MNNRGEAIVPSLAAAMKNITDKFLYDIGICQFDKRFLVPKEECEAFTAYESFTLIVVSHIIVVLKSVDKHGATKQMIMDPFTSYSLISAGQHLLEYNYQKKASSKQQKTLLEMSLNWDLQVAKDKVDKYLKLFSLKPADRFQCDAKLKHDVVKAVAWPKSFAGYVSSNVN